MDERLRFVARLLDGEKMAVLAKELGAPSGSIYYRYSSREELLAELWMDVVEEFQNGFVANLAAADDVEGAVATALFMALWTRQHPLESRLLLLHRRKDFVPGKWPADLAERASAASSHMSRLGSDCQ